MTLTEPRLLIKWSVALLAGIVLYNCGDGTGPRTALRGQLAILPAFESEGAGIVDVSQLIVRVTRLDETLAAEDTFALDRDSGEVTVEIDVRLQRDPEEMFVELIVLDSEGNVVFRGGPDVVFVSTDDATGEPVQVSILYVGVGAEAIGVTITSQVLQVVTGGMLSLDAVAIGPDDEPIPGTPILWRSLDPAVATVPDRESGVVVAGTTPGSARIEAKLLTDLTDVVTIDVVPPRPPGPVFWISPTSGNWSDPANWDVGVPGPGDTVFITIDGTYIVTLDVPASVAELNLGDFDGTGNITLAVANPLTVTDDAILAGPGVMSLGDGGRLDGGRLSLDGVLQGAAPAGAVVTMDIAGNAGVVEVSTGTLSARGDVILTPSDRLQGNGILDLQLAQTVTLDATIAPGNTPGVLGLDGNVTFSTATTLEIELAGPGVVEIDRLDVLGSIALNGTLDVSLVAPFFPTAGQRFTVMTFGSRTGTFAVVNGLDLGNGFFLDTVFSGNALELVTLAPRLQFSVPPTNVLPGQDIRPTIEVQALDGQDNVMSNFFGTVDLTLAANPGGATLSGQTSAAADGGTSFFAFVGLDALGSGYTLRASSLGFQDDVSPPFEVRDGILWAGDSLGFGTGVYSVHPDATHRQFINATAVSGVNRAQPRWSPDRLRVAYVARPLGLEQQLFVTSSNGDTTSTVVSDTSTFTPRWSPDGTHLAFHCGDGFSVGQDVCVVPDVTGDIPSLSNAGNFANRIVVTDAFGFTDGPGTFAWDPTNPDRIAVVRNGDVQGRTASQILTVNFDGSAPAALSTLLAIPGGDTLRVFDIDWAPDGSFLAFTAEIVNQFGNRRVYRIDRDGSNLTVLTPLAGSYDEDRPVISPDGTRILYLQNRFDFEASDFNYFWVPATGGVPTQISDELSGFVFGDADLTYDFSPDGSEIVFVGLEGANLAIYTAPVGTTVSTYFTLRRLMSGPQRTDVTPSWRP